MTGFAQTPGGSTPAVGGDERVATIGSGDSIIETRWGPAGPVNEGSDSPDGSGCTPGSTTLPDGIWFVVLAGASSGAIDVDLACRYSPDLETGFYDHGYSNNNPALRQVPVAAAFTLWYLEEYNPSLGWIGVDGSVFPARTGGPPSISGWLLIENGLAVEFWETFES